MFGDSQMIDFFRGVACSLIDLLDMDAGPPLPPEGRYDE
jgi:hypothetical protein